MNGSGPPYFQTNVGAMTDPSFMQGDPSDASLPPFSSFMPGGPAFSAPAPVSWNTWEMSPAVYEGGQMHGAGTMPSWNYIPPLPPAAFAGAPEEPAADQGHQGKSSPRAKTARAGRRQSSVEWQTMNKQAQNKRRIREKELWNDLDNLTQEAAEGVPGGDKGAISTLGSGRTKVQVLEAVLGRVQALRQATGAPIENMVSAPPQEAEVPAQVVSSFSALYTAPHVGMLVLDLRTGDIRHMSKTFEDMFEWLGVDTVEGMRFSTFLQVSDGHKFRQYHLGIISGEESSEEGSESFPMRFLLRPPGPRGLRAPGWMLVYSRPVTLTLTKLVKDSGLAVFIVDLKDVHAQKIESWGVHAAHYRNLIDTGILNNIYTIDWNPLGMDPLEMLYAGIWYQGDLEDPKSFQVSRLAKAVGVLAGWLFKKTCSFNVLTSWQFGKDDTLYFVNTKNLNFSGMKVGESDVDKVGKDPITPAEKQEILSEIQGPKRIATQPRREVWFAVADNQVELDGFLRMTYFSLARAPKTRGAPRTSARAEMAQGRRFATLTVEAPWSTGNIAHRFEATCRVVTAEGEIIEDLTNGMASLQPMTDVWLDPEDAEKLSRQS